MSRHILAEEQIHPAVRAQVSGYHRTLVEEVQAAVASNKVVVVGMGLNPFRARRASCSMRRVSPTPICPTAITSIPGVPVSP
jgi:hypothetical protein